MKNINIVMTDKGGAGKSATAKLLVAKNILDGKPVGLIEGDSAGAGGNADVLQAFINHELVETASYPMNKKAEHQEDALNRFFEVILDMEAETIIVNTPATVSQFFDGIDEIFMEALAESEIKLNIIYPFVDEAKTKEHAYQTLIASELGKQADDIILVHNEWLSFPDLTAKENKDIKTLQAYEVAPVPALSETNLEAYKRIENPALIFDKETPLQITQRLGLKKWFKKIEEEGVLFSVFETE